MAKTGTLAFTDPDEMERQINAYFDGLIQTRKMKTRAADGSIVEWEETYHRPPTMAGLALALNMTRVGLMNYRERDGFLPVLSRAKGRIAEFAEEALYTREASNGARFALEVNHGYGREDGDGDGDGAFVMKIIAPTGAQNLAIAKWEPRESDE
jgi:hypothetical protein